MCGFGRHTRFIELSDVRFGALKLSDVQFSVLKLSDLWLVVAKLSDLWLLIVELSDVRLQIVDLSDVRFNLPIYPKFADLSLSRFSEALLSDLRIFAFYNCLMKKNYLK